jgi:hypothetical protein
MAIFARGGQDALYPALSGEWEVPVTRNAKITPVNEGGGGPPLRGSPLVGSGSTVGLCYFCYFRAHTSPLFCAPARRFFFVHAEPPN